MLSYRVVSYTRRVAFRRRTVHGLSLHLVPALVPVDLELKLLFWCGDLSDLVIFGDEVPDLS